MAGHGEGSTKAIRAGREWRHRYLEGGRCVLDRLRLDAGGNHPPVSD